MDNTELIEVNPLFKSVAEMRGFYDESLIKKISRTGSIQDLDEIPELVNEKNYRLDFFYAERHTTDSHIRITTNIIGSSVGEN